MQFNFGNSGGIADFNATQGAYSGPLPGGPTPVDNRPISVPQSPYAPGAPVMGPSANPSAGAAGFNNPSAPPISTPQTPTASTNTGNPWRAPGGAVPGLEYFGGYNWNPSFQSNPGYNSSQYATTDTANALVGAVGSGLGLGGNVVQTRNAAGSPIGPPPQQSIDFGGDSPLNAGLLAERYAKYDHATADAMTRAELALQGPKQAPNEDSQGGSMGSWSMFGPSAGGSQNLKGGQNIGQFVGENRGGAFGSQPSPIPPPQQQQYWPQQQSQNYGYGPSAAPLQQAMQGGYGGGYSPFQMPQFRQNRGGFGAANQFSQANMFSPHMQLMQMFMGGGQGGGNIQTRNRQSPFQSGNMSGLSNMMNSFGSRGAGSFNPFSSSGGYGGGGMMGYYPQYR